MQWKEIFQFVSAVLSVPQVGPRKRRRRNCGLGHTETMEVRAFPAATLGTVISQFDDGMVRLRRAVPEIADDAFSGDLPQDTPLIREDIFAADQRFVTALTQFFRGNVSGVGSIDAAKSKLEQFGYTVQYIGLNPNAQGDFIRLTKSMSIDPTFSYSTPVNDLNGLSYFSQAAMKLSGTLSGKIGEIAGTVTIGLDSRGIYLGSASTISAKRISLSGSVIADGTLGALQRVSMNASTAFSGRVEMSLRDSDRDGKIRPAELRRDEVVVGQLIGRASLDNAQFSSEIPWISTIAWSGSIKGQISGNVMTSTTDLNVPQYSTLVNQLNVGFVNGIKNLSWVQRVEHLLNAKVPFSNKTMAQLVKFDSLVDKGIKKLTGVELISGTQQQQAAMWDLVSGRDVTLLSFRKSGSELIAEADLVPEFKIIDANILAGLVRVNVSASVTASATFDYTVSAGIGSKGFWIGDTTTIGLGAGIYGNLKGAVEVLSVGVAEAKGSLGIIGTAFFQISDPTPGDGKVYFTDIAVQPSDVPRNLMSLVSFDYTVDLHAKMSAKVLGVKVWSDERKLATLIQGHEGPKSSKVGYFPKRLVRSLWDA